MVDFILGDNPFFGVSHASYIEQGHNHELMRVYETAADICSSFMLSPHPGYTNILQSISEVVPRSKRLPLSLVFPYPHTVNDLLAAGGLLKVLQNTKKMTLIKGVVDNIFPLIVNGKIKKFENIWAPLLDIELRQIDKSGHEVSHLCLHNVLTDLLIATDHVDAIEGFINCCKQKGVKPVLLTQNIPACTRFIKTKKLETKLCGTFNPNGYMVNPGYKETHDILKSETTVDIWLMQIFASGRASILDVKREISCLNDVKSLVVTSRSADKLRSTILELSRN